MVTSTEDIIFQINPYTLPKMRTYKRVFNNFVINELSLDQAYYWTQQWQEGEHEADRDITENKMDTFTSPREAIDYLHKLRDDSNQTD